MACTLQAMDNYTITCGAHVCFRIKGFDFFEEFIEFLATFPLTPKRGGKIRNTIWLTVRKYKGLKPRQGRPLYLTDAPSSSSGFGGEPAERSVPAFSQSRSRSRSLSRGADVDARVRAEGCYAVMKSMPTPQKEREIYKTFVKTWHPDLVGRTGDKYDVKFATAVFQHFMTYME